MKRHLIILLALLLGSIAGYATEYHVAKNGSDLFNRHQTF